MQIVKASKSNKKLRIAMFGDSQTGKTHSSLLLASTLGSRILVIDSEDGASNVLSDLFKFDVLTIQAISLKTYTEAVETAIKHQRDYDVIILDSLSHAWQAALEDVAKIGAQRGWGQVTPKWDKLMHLLKELNTHLIVTMRQKTRQDDQQKWVDVPDTRENSEYDYDIIFKMKGLGREADRTVAQALITKCRFNTGSDKVKVGRQVNLTGMLIKHILEWQGKGPAPAAAQPEQTDAARLGIENHPAAPPSSAGPEPPDEPPIDYSEPAPADDDIPYGE